MFWLFAIGLVVLALVGVGLLAINRTNGTIQIGGRSRRYLLYVPDSYSPDRPAPLVISIHGLVQWPAHQRGLTRWNDLADQGGFLVVYPRGTGFPLRWHTVSRGVSGERSAAEIDFIAALIDQISQTYPIDPRRIYANGMSNGAGLTNLLAWKLSDRIAAFGGVAGAYVDPLDAEPPPRPIPWIIFHGTADPIVPYQGRTSAVGPRPDRLGPVEEWAAGWVDRNGPADRQERELTPRVLRIVFQGDRSGARLDFYRIEGAGHTWPGGGWIPRWLAGKINREISATKLMWEFFQNYSLDETLQYEYEQD